MWNNILNSGFTFSTDNKSLEYKFKLINSILIIAISGSWFIASIFMFIGTSPTQTFVINLELSFSFLFFCLFVFLRKDKKNLNIVIYISIFSLYIFQVLIMINLIEDSLREAWYFLTIILSFFLAGKKFGQYIFLLVFTTMIVYNFQPFWDTNLNEIESVVPIVLLFLIVLVINLYEKTKENYSDSLQKANSALEDKIEELNQFNINLESRVKDEVKKNRAHELILFEQSKMAVMGEMIGNIAHQWRQPLSVISTTSTGAKIQKDLDLLTNDMFQKNMDIINDNAQYLSQTIDDFRNFVKEERVKKQFDLKDYIDSFLHLVQGSIKSNFINMNLNLADGIKMIGYPNELIQCFINIFNNSKDEIINIPLESRLIFIETYINNNKVFITFKDNAGGISKDVLPKVFDPYFTTKANSKGTGLGLHMTYKLIVDGMDGTIEANNVKFGYKGKEYKGAEFKITLPIK